MKTIVLMLAMICLLQVPLKGQWYYRHHKVNNLNELTIPQLELSKKKSSTSIYIGSTIAGALVGLSVYGSVNESYVFLALAARLIVFSPGILYGTIKTISNCRRINLINSLIESKIGKIETSINPTLQQYGCDRKYSAGLTITMHF